MASFVRARSPLPTQNDMLLRSGSRFENGQASRGAIEYFDPGARTLNTYDTARFPGASASDQDWLRQREQTHHLPNNDAPISPSRSVSWTRGAGEIMQRDRELSPLHDVARQRAESLERELAARNEARDRLMSESVASGKYKTPVPAKDFHQVQRALEQVQKELHFQNKHQDDVLDRVGRAESDLSRVSELMRDNDVVQSTEKQQRHQALQNLTRRTEEALLTCESLKKTQDYHIQKFERLEARGGDRATEELDHLRNDVDALQGAVREKMDVFGQALRKLEQMERVFDENAKLRQEVSQLRRQNERRDLEMAAVQGQIDALTKLVREQLKEPPSPGGARDRAER